MKSPISRNAYVLGLLFTAFFILSTTAQVGIGTITPNSDALLDVDASSTNGGILLPRIALTSTSSPSPLTADVAGMIVYNTATAGDVTPGFYYNDGTDWIRLGAGSASDDWKTTGNAGTIPGTKYIGTSDSKNLIFKTNGSENMRLLTDGSVSINNNSPVAGNRFTVTGNSNDYAINGYATGATGVSIYGESASYDAIVGNASRIGIYGLGNYGVYGSGATYGVFGVANNATGFGMIANNDNATGVGILVSGSNAPLNYLSNTGASINGSLAIAGFSTSAAGTGISGIGNGSTTSQILTNGSGVAGSGDTGVYGRSASTTGTGIIGVGNNNSVITTHAKGSGIAGTGSNIGVFGYAGNGDDTNANYGNAGGEFVLDGDNDPTTNSNDSESNRARAILAGYNNVSATDSTGTNWSSKNSYFGGYFSGGNENGGNQNYSYTALRYRIGSNGTSGSNTTDFKVIGPGSNSTLINDAYGAPRIMFSPEAPEILFQDFGVGQLVNGSARIIIDPVLKKSIYIDSEHPLKVYVTLEGECNGIYVTNKSADGFTVKELQRGTSNVSFSWQIVASRADTKDNSGRIVSKHVGVRLPIGPGPLTSELKKLETTENTTKEEKNNIKDISKNRSSNSTSKTVISKPKK